MTDPLVVEAHNLNPNNNCSSEFDSLPIPPMDSVFFETNTQNINNSETFDSDLGFGFGFDDNSNFELTFDDIDDFYLPSENEEFIISEHCLDSVQLGVEEPIQSQPVQVSDSISGSSGVSTDHVGSDVSKFLNFSGSGSGSAESGSGDAPARVLNFPSPESGGSESGGGGSVSSQGSENGPRSPNVIVVDQMVKVEEETASKNCVSKRKKDHVEEGISADSRTPKYRRSSETVADSVSFEAAPANEDEEKRKARLMRNRESAQLSRQRKKHYVEELEDKVRSMHSTIAELNSKISYFMAENATLRQQLSGNVQPPPPHSGMYPHPAAMAPMGYPWMPPCAPYVIKQQGSQVPLVPIPRLKPQQPVPAPKAKKPESRKSEGKTKKVASVSFLGLLFFVMLFGGLVPFVNVRYGGIGDKVPGGAGYVSDRFYDRQHGRVLSVNEYSNGSRGSVGGGFSSGEFDNTNKVNYVRGRVRIEECERKGQGSQPLPGSDESIRFGNGSEPLVASLYVPRNDKLVKIDGNLIIHSVLASEKAMASQAEPEKKDNKETGLAIHRDLAQALAIPEVGGNRGRHSHVYRNPTGGQKALASGSADTLKDNLKSAPADGKLQQWFREGLAGPMLSSGMCTEVFQFDASPASAPGAIIPASSVSNVPAKHLKNATRLSKGRNRRILNRLPIPVAGSNYNITEEHVRNSSQKESFQGNKSSSMIVSVLVDPREAGDSEVDGMIRPKSLSRIFVVVLMDSVKYVTYSCVLPRSGLI
ncbi:bZIP transcription factor 17 [Quercus suber]|uniref:Bzip transcription factor 17 n=1 Tax=Quercus suber TaxID=58331 RepID=A0AAW0JNM6_QUESU|nr:bZIP transcription factor 17-like isoform X1 [Quercus suber]